MYRSPLIFSALLFVLLASPACRKQRAETTAVRQGLIQQAKTLIDSLSTHGYAINYRASQPKTILWGFAALVPLGKATGLVIPVVYSNDLLMRASYTGKDLFHLNYLTRVVFNPDSPAGRSIRVVTDFPDSNFFKDPTGPFTGIRFVEDWYGHPLEKLLFTPDGHIKRYVPTNKEPEVTEVIETCYEIIGYNYSPDEPDEVYYWSEPAGCSVDYIDDGAGDDLGGAGSAGPSGGGSNGSATFSILPGNSVIKNIQTYFQCFTNVGGSDHTYTVNVCVAQPDPGARTPWAASGDGSSGSSGGNNPVNVGHAFLTLTESYGGTTITRNVGFYPADNVNPFGASSQGTLNDDETDQYNISGSFTVNNSQFFSILNFVSQGNTPGYLYNMNTNNCATFAINAVAQAGIVLPRTIGTWFDGAGNDPGDLGEDLRNDNIAGMTLNTNGGTSGSHLNTGQCN